MIEKSSETTHPLQNTSGNASDNIVQDESREIDKIPLIYMHDLLHDYVFIFRADNFSFICSNLGTQQYLGYTEVDLMAMTLLDISPEIMPEQFHEILRPIIEGERSSYTFRTFHRNKNQQSVPVEVIFQNLYHDNEISISSFLDNKEQRSAIFKIQNECIKKLQCMNMIREYLALEDFQLDEVFQKIALSVTSAMQFPEIASVVLDINGNRLTYPGHIQDIARGLHAKIRLDNNDERNSSYFSVFYCEDKPFMLPFEQNLVSSIANQIGIWMNGRHTKSQLKKSIKQTESIRHALDASSIVAITNRRGEITYVNEKFCAISKYTTEELLGQNHRILNSNHHPAIFFQELWKTISSGQIWRGEIKNRAKDGTFYWVDTTIVPYLDDDGKPIQYIAIRNEITKRKQTESLLLESKFEAEKANRAKDSFLATISHEIRTPLGGLLGMLELLEYTPLNQDQSQILQSASDSGKNLMRILNDILDWSKIEAGKLELAPTDTSIAGLVTQVANTYARIASAKNLILTYQIDGRIQLSHIVDPLRLLQILNNFVSNALKFTEKGHVKIEVKSLSRCGNLETLQFSVEDTGIGISESKIKSLFQEYSQNSADTARLYGGTGLGLSICRRLAELMNGTIKVESELSKGSVFRIILDLPVSELSEKNFIKKDLFDQDDNTVSQQQLPSSVIQKNGAPILVVDDHPINRKLMESQLNILGLSYKTAENGAQAFEMWHNEKFRLIITDCHMPVMDGYQLTQMIRQIEHQEKRRHIPIIGWSANALPENSRHCQQIGMNFLLTKPTNIIQLKEALKIWLQADSDNKAEVAADTERILSDGIEVIKSEILAKFSHNPADTINTLKDFMEQTRVDYNQLLLSFEQQSLSDILQIAHYMKGASQMVEASELAVACEAAEEFAKRNSEKNSNEVIEMLTLAMNRLDLYVSRLK